MSIKNVSILTEDVNNRLAFNKSTWWISDLYGKCLEKVDAGKIRKIAIIVSENGNNQENIHVKILIDVALIYVSFDINKYISKSNLSKKRDILHLSTKALLYFFEKHNLDTRSILNVHEYILRNNLRNRFLFKNKYYISPNKNLFAAFLCKWDCDVFNIDCLVLNKKKTKLVSRTRIYSCEPHLVHPFDSAKWNGSNLILESKTPFKQLIVSIY